jgi:hypothetical protein
LPPSKPGVGCCVRLKIPLQPELDFALIVRQRGADSGSSALVGIIAGQFELRVVGDVEEFGTEAQSVALGKGELLHETHVEIDLPRPAEIAASAIPELMGKFLPRR